MRSGAVGPAVVRVAPEFPRWPICSAVTLCDTSRRWAPVDRCTAIAIRSRAEIGHQILGVSARHGVSRVDTVPNPFKIRILPRGTDERVSVWEMSAQIPQFREGDAK
jgi:hypothetical protein